MAAYIHQVGASLV